MNNDPKKWRAPDTTTPSERLVKLISHEMSILWISLRDVTIECEHAEAWARRAVGTRNLDEALDAANKAARCQWRCNNVLGVALGCYEQLSTALGELAPAEESRLILTQARELGGMIRLRAERALLEARRAHEAEQKLAAELATRQRGGAAAGVRS